MFQMKGGSEGRYYIIKLHRIVKIFGFRFISTSFSIEIIKRNQRIFDGVEIETGCKVMSVGKLVPIQKVRK